LNNSQGGKLVLKKLFTSLAVAGLLMTGKV